MSGNPENTPMLGTYVLDGDTPTDPQIVLANCQDTMMLGQLVTLFGANPVIRFFLVPGESEISDPSMEFFFVKDNGNWVLASGSTLTNVLFDDTGFNPGGSEGTFSIIQEGDGTYTIATGVPSDAPVAAHLLVDIPEEDIFTEVPLGGTDSEAEHFFIDPSVLDDGESEIIVNNFRLGSDILELPDDMSVKDVLFNSETDYTDVVIGRSTDDTGEFDIVVRLLGVSQADLPKPEYGADADNLADDLINQLVSSGISLD